MARSAQLRLRLLCGSSARGQVCADGRSQGCWLNFGAECWCGVCLRWVFGGVGALLAAWLVHVFRFVAWPPVGTWCVALSMRARVMHGLSWQAGVYSRSPTSTTDLWILTCWNFARFWGVSIVLCLHPLMYLAQHAACTGRGLLTATALSSASGMARCNLYRGALSRHQQHMPLV